MGGRKASFKTASSLPRGRAVARERTEYEEFRARLTCFHEAGHVVVGHSFGWYLHGVALGKRNGATYFEPPRLPFFEIADTKTERTRRLAELRKAMAVVAAGDVSGTIHQTEVQSRGYSGRHEARAYSNGWQFRTSIRYPGAPDEDPTSDYANLVRDASRICFSDAQFAWYLGDAFLHQEGGEERFGGMVEQVRAELRRAERRAEVIIKRSWDVVTAVATKLHKSKKWELSRKQLLAVFEAG